ALQHQEKIVRVVVLVPVERALQLHHHEVVAVELAHGARLEVLGELRELLREVDRLGHGHSTLRLSRRTVCVNAAASFAIWLEKAAPHVEAGSTPAAMRRSRTFGSAEKASDA